MNSAQMRLTIVLVSCVVAQAAFADPPARDHAEPRALQALKQARGQARNNDAPHAAPAAAGHSELQVHDENPALAAMKAAATRVRRDQARTARHEVLVRQLAGREPPSQLRAELRTHARRIARLQRIRVLAAQREPKLLPRIDDVIARENARHEQRVKSLMEKAKPGRGAADDDEQEEEVEE